MILEIITPEKKTFEGEVSSVKLPGSSGEFEVLNANIDSTIIDGSDDTNGDGVVNDFDIEITTYTIYREGQGGGRGW